MQEQHNQNDPQLSRSLNESESDRNDNGKTPNKKVKPRLMLIKHGGSGKWSKKQQTTYIRFLNDNLRTMTSSDLRKTKKIFIRMSNRIKTRIPQQCRSHHQKMIKLHKSSQEIIRFYREQVFPMHQQNQLIQRIEKQEVNLPPTREKTNCSIVGFYRIAVVEQTIFKLEVNVEKMGSF